jgi:hypothetical protein
VQRSTACIGCGSQGSACLPVRLQRTAIEDGGVGDPLVGGGGGETVYRMASGGQDTQLALWDVAISEEAVAMR